MLGATQAVQAHCMAAYSWRAAAAAEAAARSQKLLDARSPGARQS